MPLVLRSPAKINLFLRIIKKREDGYHELSSLMQAISLFDTLTFEIGEEDRLISSDPAIPVNHTNLVLKAADLFRKKTGLQFGLHVKLHKKIPAEGGLGGGSGNAATTLWALNEIFKRPAATSDLMEWGGEIGSDISFFFSCGSALCQGRGEQVVSLEPLKHPSIWVVKPGVGLPTPKVYQALNLELLSKEKPEQLLNSFRNCEPKYVNDLEKPAFSLAPQLLLLKSSLEKNGPTLLSGSGSSFFCVGDQRPDIPCEFTSEAHFVYRSENTWY